MRPSRRRWPVRLPRGTSRHVRLPRSRQAHRYASARSHFTAERDRAAMLLGDVTGTRQADTCAADSGAHIACPVTALKHDGLLGSRDPNSVVDNLENGAIAIAAHRHQYALLFQAVLQGVSQQVVQHLRQPGGIPGHPDRGFGNLALECHPDGLKGTAMVVDAKDRLTFNGRPLREIRLWRRQLPVGRCALEQPSNWELFVAGPLGHQTYS